MLQLMISVLEMLKNFDGENTDNNKWPIDHIDHKAMYIRLQDWLIPCFFAPLSVIFEEVCA